MKRFMKSSYLTALALAVAAVAWVFSGDLEQAKRYYGFTDARPAEAGAAPKADAQRKVAGDGQTKAVEKAPPTVRVRRLEAQERLREITVTGRTDIIRDAEVTAETTGRIVELAASKGQWLDKGDVILRLAMDDRQSRLREAEARVRFEKIGYEAAKKLSRKGFQSQVRLAQEKSEWETAKAELAAARLDIQRTEIRAPIDGYLDSLPLGVGDYLKSGDRVVTMVNPDPMRAVVQISELDVVSLAKGDTAIARTVDAREFAGKIRFISRRADETTRTFRVDVWINNPHRDLRDGQTTEVVLRAGKEKAHKVSPAVLTLNDAGVVGVKYVDADLRVRFQGVRIIAHAPDGIWLGGLPDVVDLITVGQEFVIDGQLVRPVFESAIAERSRNAS